VKGLSLLVLASSTVVGDVLHHRLPNQIVLDKDELDWDLKPKTKCSLVDVHVSDVVRAHPCLEVVHRSFSA